MAFMNAFRPHIPVLLAAAAYPFKSLFRLDNWIQE